MSDFKFDPPAEVGNVIDGLEFAKQVEEIIQKTTDDINYLQSNIVPIGAIFPVATQWGAPKPDNSGRFKYVQLTFGLADLGGYNEGLLSDESYEVVPHDKNSGYGTSIQSTATITYSGSPLIQNQIRLINTEKRYLRAGGSDFYDDYMREMIGDLGYGSDRLFSIASGVFEGVKASGGNGVGSSMDTLTPYSRGRFKASNSAPTGAEITPKTQEFAYFMRIA